MEKQLNISWRIDRRLFTIPALCILRVFAGSPQSLRLPGISMLSIAIDSFVAHIL
jgi:hypothetical protein